MALENFIPQLPATLAQTVMHMANVGFTDENILHAIRTEYDSPVADQIVTVDRYNNMMQHIIKKYG